MVVLTRRRRYVLVAAFLLAAVVLTWVWVVGEEGEFITADNFERLQTGMTEAEVIAIVGRPADQFEDIGPDPSGSHQLVSFHKWTRADRGGVLCLVFDQHGKLVRKSYGYLLNPPTAAAKIREWLRWAHVIR